MGGEFLLIMEFATLSVPVAIRLEKVSALNTALFLLKVNTQ